jgi:hypothetical protein
LSLLTSTAPLHVDMHQRLFKSFLFNDELRKLRAADGNMTRKQRRQDPRLHVLQNRCPLMIRLLSI